MTAREIYEAMLIETAAYGIPELFIDEANYYLNKAVLLVVDEAYKVFEETQVISDALACLKKPKEFTGVEIKNVGSTITQPNSGNLQIKEAKYHMILPSDYYHLLHCIITYDVKQNYRCFNQGYKIEKGTERLKSDRVQKIYDNAWLKPSYKRPYHQVMANMLFDTGTSTWTSRSIEGNWPTNAAYNTTRIDQAINKTAGNREAHNAFTDSNADGIFGVGEPMSGPTLQIEYGKDCSVFELYKTTIAYVRIPALIRLTPEIIDATIDRSQIMEFPDPVNRMIVQAAALLVANRSNPSALAPSANQAQQQQSQSQQAQAE